MSCVLCSCRLTRQSVLCGGIVQFLTSSHVTGHVCSATECDDTDSIVCLMQTVVSHVWRSSSFPTTARSYGSGAGVEGYVGRVRAAGSTINGTATADAASDGGSLPTASAAACTTAVQAATGCLPSTTATGMETLHQKHPSRTRAELVALEEFRNHGSGRNAEGDSAGRCSSNNSKCWRQSSSSKCSSRISNLRVHSQQQEQERRNIFISINS